MLFHSIKQDPYYKHHLRTYLSRFAEETAEKSLSMPYGPHDVDPNDFAKFDRINIFDLRRNLPQKDRESKIDAQGCAWGHGKRKSSTALARVSAGSGKVTINGKPMLEEFHHPTMRNRLLLPLTITNYTCLLDVDIKVTGGGTTG